MLFIVIEPESFSPAELSREAIRKLFMRQNVVFGADELRKKNIASYRLLQILQSEASVYVMQYTMTQLLQAIKSSQTLSLQVRMTNCWYRILSLD